ncbi:hypothetical protein AVEN_180432-1 [Araneus ventricosus]|uniref:Uncharacterized protein n=1 Tax=Araneus ventricosus TaxID=182803 RepID=A0A4Y2MMG9_ARAVE|nr:hypothetical protein AVEN_180432-1 [Araneus ventricosus]
MKNLLQIVIGFWVTVGSNLSTRGRGKTTLLGKYTRKFRGDHSRCFFKPASRLQFGCQQCTSFFAPLVIFGLRNSYKVSSSRHSPVTQLLLPPRGSARRENLGQVPSFPKTGRWVIYSRVAHLRRSDIALMS